MVLIESVGTAVVGGLSSGALLILLLKLLERRVTRNEKAISDGTKRHYKDLATQKSVFDKKIQDQEDCWEEEIGKVNDTIGQVHDDVQKVITVMQMQTDDPKVVEILKGG